MAPIHNCQNSAGIKTTAVATVAEKAKAANAEVATFCIHFMELLRAALDFAG